MMSLFQAFIALICFVFESKAQTSHSFRTNGDCAYFVTESTPIPLYLCMQWQYNTKSFMYKCEDNIISMVHWNNPVCTDTVNQTFYLNNSVVSDIHNCNAPQSFNNYQECNLASLSIWNSEYGEAYPNFQLLYVVDVCININNQNSIYFGCDDDKGTIKQDIYDNNGYCLGTPMNYSQSDSSIIDGADSNAGNDMCFKMRCNNKTYISCDGTASSSSIGTHSFWNSADSEEILFIIAAGSALVIFWSCYCYRKHCRVSKEQIDAEINNKGNNKQNKEKYDELDSEDEIQDEHENEKDGQDENEINANQKIDAENLNNDGDNKSAKLLGDGI